VQVTLLLCDAAQVSNGKLFVLGGGWNMIAANTPANLALALLFAVPWDQTNKQINVEAKLMTADGEPFRIGDQAVEAMGQMEVGRPPGVKPGTDMNAPLAIPFNGIVVPPGGYRWEIWVDNEMSAFAPFRAIEGAIG
jgi:hypothetical protein